MSAKKPVPARKITAVKKPMTKSAMIEEIAQNTQLNKKQVSSVLEEFAILIEHHIKKRAPGQCTSMLFNLRRRGIVKQKQSSS